MVNLTIRDAALFLCVWIIYLFDRLYDSRKLVQAESTLDEALPLRHRFTIRHQGLITGLLLFGIILLLSLSIFLEKSDWILGLCIGAGVISYFVLFRFAQKIGGIDQFLARFPAKEFALATFFAAGVLNAAERYNEGAFSFVQNLVTGIAFALLVVSNCLLIAFNERQFDQNHDSASYFSNSERTILPIQLPLYALTVISAVSLGFAWQDWHLCLIIFIAASGLLLIHLSPLPVPYRQPAFDAVLLIPWISIFFA